MSFIGGCVRLEEDSVLVHSTTIQTWNKMVIIILGCLDVQFRVSIKIRIHCLISCTLAAVSWRHLLLIRGCIQSLRDEIVLVMMLI